MGKFQHTKMLSLIKQGTPHMLPAWRRSLACRGEGAYGLRGRALQVGAAQAVQQPLCPLELPLHLWWNIRRWRHLPQGSRVYILLLAH